MGRCCYLLLYRLRESERMIRGRCLVRCTVSRSMPGRADGHMETELIGRLETSFGSFGSFMPSLKMTEYGSI